MVFRDRIPNTSGIRRDPPACGDPLNKGVLKLAAFLREFGGDVLGAIAFYNSPEVAIALNKCWVEERNPAYKSLFPPSLIGKGVRGLGSKPKQQQVQASDLRLCQLQTSLASSGRNALVSEIEGRQKGLSSGWGGLQSSTSQHQQR